MLGGECQQVVEKLSKLTQGFNDLQIEHNNLDATFIQYKRSKKKAIHESIDIFCSGPADNAFEKVEMSETALLQAAEELSSGDLPETQSKLSQAYALLFSTNLVNSCSNVQALAPASA